MKLVITLVYVICSMKCQLELKSITTQNNLPEMLPFSLNLLPTPYSLRREGIHAHVRGVIHQGVMRGRRRRISRTTTEARQR